MCPCELWPLKWIDSILINKALSGWKKEKKEKDDGAGAADGKSHG